MVRLHVPYHYKDNGLYLYNGLCLVWNGMCLVSNLSNCFQVNNQPGVITWLEWYLSVGLSSKNVANQSQRSSILAHRVHKYMISDSWSEVKVFIKSFVIIRIRGIV